MQSAESKSNIDSPGSIAKSPNSEFGRPRFGYRIAPIIGGMSRDTFQGAAAFVPERQTLPELREAAQHCKGCNLYLYATQAVMGEGPRSSHLMMVGEQPGNDEDMQGHPFVGPAGKLLDRALVEAGIDRGDVYITNAVKHFKFEERGKRRLHKKPRVTEVRACLPWLEAEVSVDSSASHCLLGCYRRAVHPGAGLSFDHRKREICAACLGALRNRYRPPLFDSPSAGPRTAPHPISGVCCGSQASEKDLGKTARSCDGVAGGACVRASRTGS